MQTGDTDLLMEVRQMKENEERKIYTDSGEKTVEGIPIMNTKKMPYIFKGKELYRQKFWCPFCKEWHTHGVGEGHRQAHCHPQVKNKNTKIQEYVDSPYEKTGYYLRLKT
jgi:hypothetical protein